MCPGIAAGALKHGVFVGKGLEIMGLLDDKQVCLLCFGKRCKDLMFPALKKTQKKQVEKNLEAPAAFETRENPLH